MWKRRRNVSRKRKTRSSEKLFVKKQLINDLSRLLRMKARSQQPAVICTSNEFIRDINVFFQKIRKQPHLVKTSYRKISKRHQKILRQLIHIKTPLHKKSLFFPKRMEVFQLKFQLFVH